MFESTCEVAAVEGRKDKLELALPILVGVAPSLGSRRALVGIFVGSTAWLWLAPMAWDTEEGTAILTESVSDAPAKRR